MSESTIYSMAPYDPEEIDIQWAKHVIRLLKEDATLVFPSSQLIYSVSHRDKRLVLINDTLLDDSEGAFVAHSRTIEVFKQAVGYDVIPGWEEMKMRQETFAKKPPKGERL